MVARRSNRSKKSSKEVDEEVDSHSEDEIEKLVDDGNEKDDDNTSDDDVTSNDELDEADVGVDDEVGDDDEDDSEEDEGSDSVEEGDDDDDEDAEPVAIKPLTSATGEQCTFDLLNLLALNSHQVDIAKLYSQNAHAKDNEKVTIPGETMPFEVNDELLLEKATDGCTQLIHALWQLPTERSDAGPLVVLPAFSETKLPRQLVSTGGIVLHVLHVLSTFAAAGL
jgi:hypothetical protein